MAGGPTTVELVAAVCRAGGLGMIAGAMLSPAQIREQAAAIRRLTDRPFGINLFVLPAAAPDAATLRAAQARLAPFHDELGLPPPAIPNAWGEELAGQLAAVLDAAPAIVTTHFGAPPESFVAALRARGTPLAVSATTPDEARALEAAGADFIVAQGAEAGGHRGTFLACPEAGTHPLHRAALASAAGTMITRGVTGRHARGLRNRLLETLDRDAGSAPDYRVQNALAGPLRAAAAKQGRAELMAMWAGQGHRLATDRPAGELVRAFAAEAASILRVG